MSTKIYQCIYLIILSIKIYYEITNKVLNDRIESCNEKLEKQSFDKRTMRIRTLKLSQHMCHLLYGSQYYNYFLQQKVRCGKSTRCCIMPDASMPKGDKRYQPAVPPTLEFVEAMVSNSVGGFRTFRSE